VIARIAVITRITKIAMIKGIEVIVGIARHMLKEWREYKTLEDIRTRA